MTNLPLTESYLTERPSAAARHLENEPTGSAARLLAGLEPRIVAPVVSAMLPATGAAVLAHAGVAVAARIIDTMDRNAATRMLRVWPDAHDSVLAALDKRTATTLRLLMAYDPRSVGAHFDPAAPAFDSAVGASDALARLCRHGQVPDLVAVIASDGTFMGTVTLREMLAAPASATLGRLTQSWSAPLLDVQRLGTAADHEGWIEHIALPVVDRQRRFVGMLHRRALARHTTPPAPELSPGLQLWTHLLQVFVHCIANVASFAGTPAPPSRPKSAP